MKKLLMIAVEVTGKERVRGSAGEAEMIFFTGTAGGDYFHGAVSGTGVDTQKVLNGKRTLSARYILKGTDYTGKECSVFIENNAELWNSSPLDPLTTVPIIITDSENLKWMETESVIGKLIPAEKGPLIEIYGK